MNQISEDCGEKIWNKKIYIAVYNKFADDGNLLRSSANDTGLLPRNWRHRL